MKHKTDSFSRDGNQCGFYRNGRLPRARILSFFLSLICLVIPFFALVWTIIHHTLPYGDEAEYLELARSLHDDQGYVSRIHWLYRADVTVDDYRPEANRAPGLPWLISCYWHLTDRMPIFWLQLANSLLFLFGLALLGLFLQRLSGPLIAWLTVLLCGLSPLNVWLAARLLPESLFFLFFVMCLWLLVTKDNEVLSMPRLVLLGVFCGLAGYFRPNANLLLIGFILVLLIDGKRHYPFRLFQSLVVIGVYLVIRTPWLVRNYVVFGSPWYNDLGYFIWVDRFNEAFGIHSSAPSAFNYISNHTLFDMAARFARGSFLVLESVTAGNVFSSELHLIGPLAPLWIPAIFSIHRLWSDRGMRGWFFVALVHGIIFAWIGMGGLVRYLYLCFPLIIAIGLWGTALLSQRLGRRTTLPIICMAAAVLFLQVRPLMLEFRKDDRAAMLRQEDLTRKIDEFIPRTEAVMAFPDLSGLSWRGQRPVLFVPSGGIDSIHKILRRYSCRTVILSVKTLFYRPSLQTWWLDNTEGRLIELASPPNWRLLTDCGEGSILIYRVSFNTQALAVQPEIESGHDMY